MKNLKFYLIAIVIVLVDQVSKVIIRGNMQLGQSISVIGEFFQITYIRNTGAAFSMLSGMRIFLILAPLMAIAICLIYLHRHKGAHDMLKTSLWMIIAGGIGNLIDRIIFGYVTDMLDFSIFPPIFNVADISVTLGCALLVIYILLEEKINGRTRN